MSTDEKKTEVEMAMDAIIVIKGLIGSLFRRLQIVEKRLNQITEKNDAGDIIK